MDDKQWKAIFAPDGNDISQPPIDNGEEEEGLRPKDEDMLILRTGIWHCCRLDV